MKPNNFKDNGWEDDPKEEKPSRQKEEYEFLQKTIKKAVSESQIEKIVEKKFEEAE